MPEEIKPTTVESEAVAQQQACSACGGDGETSADIECEKCLGTGKAQSPLWLALEHQSRVERVFRHACNHRQMAADALKRAQDRVMALADAEAAQSEQNEQEQRPAAKGD